MRTTVLTSIAMVLVASTAHAQKWDECRYEADRSANVDAASANLLRIDAGSGFLKVIGKPGVRTVTIRARACASSKDLLDDIKLETRRDGGAIVVRANKRDDENRGFSFRNNEYARLDVTMEVPAGIKTSIDDGSGELEMTDLGDVDIDDGSGEIFGARLGSVSIDDGSGEIRLEDVRGNVDIEDGSGEIELRGVAGNVDIQDGSGEINVRDAKRDVRVSDSSGSINVTDVGGDFIVRNDASGGIDYDNVRGRVDVPTKRRSRR
jgi:DUF4097 and DUF4098 domain-containing protein YvlB